VIVTSSAALAAEATRITSGRQLREKYLTPQMEGYFLKKVQGVASQEVLARIEEALKFLTLSSDCPGNIPVTQDIDDIWHYWILETLEYDRLCSLLPGGQFIHHRSNAFSDSGPAADTAPSNTLEGDVAVLATYVVNFGPFKAERTRYWRLADYLVSHSGMSVEQLNAWLLSARG
jgi:hypothetical protein